MRSQISHSSLFKQNKTLSTASQKEQSEQRVWVHPALVWHFHKSAFNKRREPPSRRRDLALPCNPRGKKSSKFRSSWNGRISTVPLVRSCSCSSTRRDGGGEKKKENHSRLRGPLTCSTSGGDVGRLKHILSDNCELITERRGRSMHAGVCACVCGYANMHLFAWLCKKLKAGRPVDTQEGTRGRRCALQSCSPPTKGHRRPDDILTLSFVWWSFVPEEVWVWEGGGGDRKWKTGLVEPHFKRRFNNRHPVAAAASYWIVNTSAWESPQRQMESGGAECGRRRRRTLKNLPQSMRAFLRSINCEQFLSTAPWRKVIARDNGEPASGGWIWLKRWRVHHEWSAGRRTGNKQARPKRFSNQLLCYGSDSWSEAVSRLWIFRTNQ